MDNSLEQLASQMFSIVKPDEVETWSETWERYNDRQYDKRIGFIKGLVFGVGFTEWYVHQKTRLTPMEALPLFIKEKTKSK